MTRGRPMTRCCSCWTWISKTYTESFRVKNKAGRHLGQVLPTISRTCIVNLETVYLFPRIVSKQIVSEAFKARAEQPRARTTAAFFGFTAAQVSEVQVSARLGLAKAGWQELWSNTAGARPIRAGAGAGLGNPPNTAEIPHWLVAVTPACRGTMRSACRLTCRGLAMPQIFLMFEMAGWRPG